MPQWNTHMWQEKETETWRTCACQSPRRLVKGLRQSPESFGSEPSCCFSGKIIPATALSLVPALAALSKNKEN